MPREAKQPTKEQLQKQLNVIIKLEEEALIKKHFPTFKKMDGQYFKIRNNYSCPEKPSDYWQVYRKIVEIKPDDVYMILGGKVACRCTCLSFEIDKYGKISIEKESVYVHNLGKEITKKEFNKAWNKLVEKLDNIEVMFHGNINSTKKK